jgi:hypothetical protein
MYRPVLRFMLLYFLVASVSAPLMAQKSGKNLYANEASKAFRLTDLSFLDQVLESGIRMPQTTTSTSPLLNTTFFGPTNAASRIRAVLHDVTNPNLLFAGSTTGGLWKSNDGGMAWSPINDQSEGMNVTCIAQSPTQPHFIYYGTGEYRNRKIRDAGSGIYRSIDQGNTFQQLPYTANAGFYYAYDICHDLNRDSVLYVATALNGVYRSMDAGQSFHTVFFNGKTVSDVHCLPGGQVLLAVSYDGVYISASGDSGTFVKSSGTPTNGFSRVEVTFCDSFPLIMYAVFADSVQSLSSGLQGMYKSIDGGQNWFTVTNPENVGIFPFADYMLSIAVKPNDPDFVVVGGEQGCYSTDGGQSYSFIQSPWIDQHRYLFSSNNPSVFYSGHDQGLSRFTINNGALTRTDLITGHNTAQVWGGGYFPSGDDLFIGAQDHKFKFNRNGASQFQTLNNYGIDGKYAHIHQQQTSIAYASGDFGYMWRSDNFLANTPQLIPILNGLDVDGDNKVDDDTWYDCRFEMNYLDGEQLCLATRNHIWRSTNRGALWNKVTQTFPSIANGPQPYALTFTNNLQPTLYSGGSKGLFMRIDDVMASVSGQETILTQHTPSVLLPLARIADLKTHPAIGGTVYAGIRSPGTSPRIWKIIGADGNNPVWVDISGNLSDAINVYCIEIDPLNPDSVIFAGTEFGLWYTTNGGIDWSRDQNFPPITIYEMSIRPSDRRLHVFTFGRGVWFSELSTPSSLGPIQFSDGEAISIFPNPTKDWIQIQTNLKEENLNFSWTLLDALGRPLLEGNQVDRLSLQNFPAGMYVMRFESGFSRFQKRIIKTN